MRVKNGIISLLVTLGLAFASGAHATIIQYGFTASGDWFDGAGTPYGMPLSPSLAGTITVDNTQSGAAALVGFSLTTGSHTWTQSEFVGGTAANISFDGGGNLADFALDRFSSGAGFLYVYLHNTMQVSDGVGAFNFCNGCMELGQGTPVVSVSEPETVALLGLSLLGLGWSRRRRKA